jgi:hypothetical protein
MLVFLMFFGACTDMPTSDVDGGSAKTDVDMLSNTPTGDMVSDDYDPPTSSDMAHASNEDMANTAPADMAPACGGNGQPCCANKMCNSTLGCLHDNSSPSVYTCHPGSSNGSYCGSVQEGCCAPTTGSSYDGYCYAANATCDPTNGNTVNLICRAH